MQDRSEPLAVGWSRPFLIAKFAVHDGPILQMGKLRPCVVETCTRVTQLVEPGLEPRRLGPEPVLSHLCFPLRNGHCHETEQASAVPSFPRDAPNPLLVFPSSAWPYFKELCSDYHGYITTQNLEAYTKTNFITFHGFHGSGTQVGLDWVTLRFRVLSSEVPQ